MMMMTTRAFLLVSCVGLMLVSLATATETFEEFKKRLANMTPEERLEFELSSSANYTRRHGELANDLRLCTNVHMNYTAE